MRLTPHRIAALIVLCFVVLASFYARAMPPFEAADEAAHFLYVHHLLEDRQLPRIPSRAEVAQLSDASEQWAIESHQPPLYYAIGALLISWSQREDIEAYLRTNSVIFVRGVTDENHNKWLHTPGSTNGDTGAALMVLRFYSMLLGALTLVFVYLGARQVFESPYVPLGAMLLTASIPTFLSISASVNNDNMVTTLYAAGVYGCLRLLRSRQIGRADLLGLSFVFSLIALAKLTGLSLFAILSLSLLLGIWRGYWSWRRAAFVLAVVAGAALSVAGWWYLRNLSLYGDPLALGATQTLWGREFEIAATSGDPGAELLRIARSFWMMFGHLHLPVYGPDWVYIYAALITALGLGGGLRAFGHVNPDRRDLLGLLLAVCGLVSFMLLAGTRSVDISYGRLLFPALVAFAPLLVLGWRVLLGRLGLLLLLPLSLMALLTPVQVIQPAYARAQLLDSLPDAASTLDAGADDLRLLAIETVQTVTPGTRFPVDLLLRGSHPQNPLLGLTAVDGRELRRLAYTEVYPGLMPTDSLPADQIVKARVWLTLDEAFEPLPPGQILLRLEWIVPATGTVLPMTDGAGTPIDSLLLNGPLLLDARYEPPAPQFVLEPAARFVAGEVTHISLAGYSLPEPSIQPGEMLALHLLWAGGRAQGDWTLTVQLFDRQGNFLTQSDRQIPAYPSRLWRENRPFADLHQIPIPEDVPAGEYQIRLGWYNVEGQRLQVQPGALSVQDELLILPQTIHIQNR